MGSYNGKYPIMGNIPFEHVRSDFRRDLVQSSFRLQLIDCNLSCRLQLIDCNLSCRLQLIL